jgi:hypothetical protein
MMTVATFRAFFRRTIIKKISLHKDCVFHKQGKQNLLLPRIRVELLLDVAVLVVILSPL